MEEILIGESQKTVNSQRTETSGKRMKKVKRSLTKQEKVARVPGWIIVQHFSRLLFLLGHR